MSYRIYPLCENALTIDFGNEISIELNEKVIQLFDFIGKSSFQGFIEAVPAYSSLTVFYDLIEVRKKYDDFPDSFSFVKNYLENALNKSEKLKYMESSLIKIPVDYSEKYAPDLEFVADFAKLSVEEVIKIHTAQIYRVFMIGFLPAFAYLGEVDERIAASRKRTPRTKIEKGSVGIAGKQTGVYPLESPGGWQIIGVTDTEIFQPENEKVSLLKTGDAVQFYDVNAG